MASRPPQHVLTIAGLLACLSWLVLPTTSLAEPGDVETLAVFDPIEFETPQSVIIDPLGNRYVSMALSGEIRKITPEGVQSTFAQLPIGMPGVPCQLDGGFTGIMGALTWGQRGSLLANVAACDPADRGVWKVERDGSKSLHVPLTPDVLPNGITRVDRWIFIADSLGKIWRAPIRGGAAEVWSDHPLLAEIPEVFAPGPNGIQYFRGEIFVANSDTAQMVAFPLLEDGSAGEPRIHAQLPFGCDDFTFDERGAIYCTTDPANVVLEVSPDGMSVEIILDVDDGLDGPTAATFGRTPGERTYLYVTNAAFPLFTVANRPSLMRIELEHRGEKPTAW